jgi:methionyl-tRNA formyltransferase
MNKKIIVVAFSSDKFFCDIYEKLKSDGIQVMSLVTESSKPQGRGLKVTRNPAHEFALSKISEIYSPSKLDSEFISKFSDKISDLKKNFSVVGLVFAYGKIIPQTIIDLFDDKIINIHPSLLPKYRGPSPIQQAILNGDKKTGYSIIKISKKMDSGDIIDQGSADINPNDNYETLRAKLLDMAVDNLSPIVRKFSQGRTKSIKQAEQTATYSKIISKSDGEINKNDDYLTAFRKIAAYHLWPKAYFKIFKNRFIIHDAAIAGNKLIILKIQQESRKVLSAKEFVNGHENLLTYFPKYVRFTQ